MELAQDGHGSGPGTAAARPSPNRQPPLPMAREGAGIVSSPPAPLPLTQHKSRHHGGHAQPMSARFVGRGRRRTHTTPAGAATSSPPPPPPPQPPPLLVSCGARRTPPPPPSPMVVTRSTGGCRSYRRCRWRCRAAHERPAAAAAIARQFHTAQGVSPCGDASPSASGCSS